MYFHTDDPDTIDTLAAVLETARGTGTRIRIDVDADGNLKIKRGGGMWSAPMRSTPDPWRDVPYDRVPN